MKRRERKRRNRRARPRHTVLRVVLIALGAGIVLGLAGLGGAAIWVVSMADSAPSLSRLTPRLQGQASEIYASNGELIGDMASDSISQPLTQAQQPQLLRDATVAIEDRRFFQHGGVDYEGLMRAAIKDVFSGGSLQGGSTLTMQLVKNVYMPTNLVASDSIRYKVIQAKLANELESKHSKGWILTQYLNDVPYGTVGGRSAYGVEAASKMFFNKSVGQLDLAQVALLAGLPQAPTTYNPFLDPSAARQRRAEVLHAMRKAGYITAAQETRADAASLQVEANSNFSQVPHPYIFQYVRAQLVGELGEAAVDRGGLKVYTTINMQDQAYANAALKENEGYKDDPAAALATVDPATGDILAIAQNTTYGDGAGQTMFNYATSATRQPGSSFKPFVLMTLIHDYDGNPSETYYNSAQLAAGWLPSNPTFSVHNAENGGMGVISVAEATTYSVNTVYAQLGVDVGMDKVDAMAHAMGITSTLYGYPAEAIGGLQDGVSPLQMADAYSTLADGGTHRAATILSKVVLSTGKTVIYPTATGTQVFSSGQAYAATKVLKTVLTQAGATGTAASYGCPAAGKTGTTSNYTDAWFVGYTPKLATAVWVGYPNATTSMTDVNGLGPGYGGTLAAPIWRDYMEKASDGYCGSFATPSVSWTGKQFVGAHGETSGYNSLTNTSGSTTTTGTGTATTGTSTKSTTTTSTVATTGTETTPKTTSTPTTPTKTSGGTTKKSK